MILLGTIVNAAAIVAGTIIGSFLMKVPENIKDTVMKAMALAVIILGIQMALEGERFLIVIGSLALGGAVGEMINLEKKLNQAGAWLERKVGEGHGDIAKAFVTATLVFTIGALAIVGALDSGLRHDHTVLFTKALLDGFCSLLFTSTLGIGVVFSAIPVFLYEGATALFATQINHFLASALLADLINAITSTGGIMILAIGLNLLGVTNIRTANLLPGLAAAAAMTAGVYYL
ncbi:MAG TPA: DUF554 domain-containing protein [Bacillales bacterium]|nr:DUF554 domain-containing protein [Bacillales bacterium]